MLDIPEEVLSEARVPIELEQMGMQVAPWKTRDILRVALKEMPLQNLCLFVVCVC
jgi:hypothetical protein